MQNGSRHPRNSRALVSKVRSLKMVERFEVNPPSEQWSCPRFDPLATFVQNRTPRSLHYLLLLNILYTGILNENQNLLQAFGVNAF
jgi:hypothetical protein